MGRQSLFKLFGSGPCSARNSRQKQCRAVTRLQLHENRSISSDQSSSADKFIREKISAGQVVADRKRAIFCQKNSPPSALYYLREMPEPTKSLKSLLMSKKHFEASSEETFFSDELKSEIFRVCSNFLGGAWSQASKNQVSVKHLRGGLSNLMFLCELNGDNNLCSNLWAKEDECKKVLLRIYCNPEIDSRLISESVVFSLLAERKVGPRLYGAFGDGRIEEFILSKTLETSDIWQPNISQDIARKLADLHKLTLPIEKSPTYLLEAMDRWISKLIEIDPNFSVNVGSDYLDMSIRNFERELNILREGMRLSESPVVFCHNDLQEGNILMPTNTSGSHSDLVIIDYEYASYNYRGFDFANHFCEWTFEYSPKYEQGFIYYPDKFPDEQQQMNFFKAYLQRSRNDENFGKLDAKIQVEKLMKEASLFRPVSHFFWSIWALLQHHTAPMDFDFLAYGKLRFQRYLDLKPVLKQLIDDRVNNNKTKQ